MKYKDIKIGEHFKYEAFEDWSYIKSGEEVSILSYYRGSSPPRPESSLIGISVTFNNDFLSKFELLPKPYNVSLDSICKFINRYKDRK